MTARAIAADRLLGCSVLPRPNGGAAVVVCEKRSHWQSFLHAGTVAGSLNMGSRLRLEIRKNMEIGNLILG